MKPRAFASFTVGESASLEREITAADVAAFVALTGDDNPVHVDDAYAKGMGLPSRVVHGMLTSGYISTAIGTQLPGPGALWMSERFSFRAPVFVGDTVRVELVVRRLSPATRVLILDVSVTNQHGKVVLDGDAQVQILERPEEMTDKQTEARTAVVTGSGRGIGAAIAKRLASDGLNVVVNFRSDEQSAQQVHEAIVAAGGNASLFGADVSQPDGAAALIAHATEAFGPVDALVNNAGMPTDPRPFAETEWRHVQAQLDSHLRSGFNCATAVMPGMIERGFGRIVNMCSQAAYGTPPAKMTGYVIAKAALAAFTRSLAVEGGPHGVTANAIAPGLTETDMVADVSSRVKMGVAAQTPPRRLSTVDDVATAVSFLIGPGAYVTGQTIHLSGGQVMT